MVKVDEPDDDTACLMLRGLKSRYADHHGVHITDDAVRAAVTLSRRYLTGRQLPDKAVDLLDTASARLRMSLDTVPEPLTRMKGAAHRAGNGEAGAAGKILRWATAPAAIGWRPLSRRRSALFWRWIPLKLSMVRSCS
ncbi:ClpB protein [Klebsiella variicola]|nr:ClpB protein [Klebsiella variicola]